MEQVWNYWIGWNNLIQGWGLGANPGCLVGGPGVIRVGGKWLGIVNLISFSNDRPLDQHLKTGSRQYSKNYVMILEAESIRVYS